MLLEVILVDLGPRVPSHAEASATPATPQPQTDPNISHIEKRCRCREPRGYRYVKALSLFFLSMSTLPLSRYLLSLRHTYRRSGCIIHGGHHGLELYPGFRKCSRCSIRQANADPLRSVGGGQRRDQPQATAPQEPWKRVLRQFSCQGPGLQFLRRTECEPLLSTNATLFLTTATTLVCKPRSLTPRM